MGVQFIADFIFFLEFNIFFRLRKYGYFNWALEPGTGLYDVLPAVSNSFHYYIKLVIYLGQVLFATNRLSSAIIIMKYEQVGQVIYIVRQSASVLDQQTHLGLPSRTVHLASSGYPAALSSSERQFLGKIRTVP